MSADRLDLSTYVPQSAEQIGAEIEKNIESYRKSFDIAFSAALKAYKKLQEEDQKSDLKNVYICYLRSSITQQLPFFRIDLYNELDIEDLEECSVDWDVEFSRQLYKNISNVKRYTHADEENNKLAVQWWFQESETFFSELKKHLPQIIQGCKVKVSPDVAWHYGEYLDHCDLL